MIDIYSDETKCKFKSFQIDSALFGPTDSCSSLKKELNTVLTKRRIKTLKGSNITDRNWHVYEKYLNDIFHLLIDSISEKKLGILIIINSHKFYNNQLGFIKDPIKNQLQDVSSPLFKLLRNVDKNLYPLLYHSLDQLFIYLAFRKVIGPDEKLFNFYPDSVGSMKKYRDKIVSISGTSKSYLKSFHEIIEIVAHLTQEAVTDYAIDINLPHWPRDRTQKLRRFYPKKDEEEIMIQIADVLSNFLLSSLRYKCGLENQSYKLKTDFFEKYVPYQVSGLSDILDNFTLASTNKITSSDIYLSSGSFTHTIHIK